LGKIALENGKCCQQDFVIHRLTNG